MWFNFNKSFNDFCAANLNVAGVIVEVMLNGKKTQILIGDISPYSSIMNGNFLFTPETIIYKYNILWQRFTKKSW